MDKRMIVVGRSRGAPLAGTALSQGPPKQNHGFRARISVSACHCPSPGGWAASKARGKRELYDMGAHRDLTESVNPLLGAFGHPGMDLWPNDPRLYVRSGAPMPRPRPASPDPFSPA